MEKDKKQSIFEHLSSINCNAFTEEKNGLTYLSWAHAWAIVKKLYPSTTYKIKFWGDKPYLYDENLGYLVMTEVTIDGETLSMQLPVMDNNNKAMKNERYAYKAKEYVRGRWTGNYIDKYVEPATMFDINTAIMRCLTKNLAMFGLGHYIYAGEDLPVTDNIKYNDEVATDANVPKETTEKLPITEKVLMSDEQFNKYYSIKDEEFPYTIKGKTYNTKKELFEAISVFYKFTEKQQELLSKL